MCGLCRREDRAATKQELLDLAADLKVLAGQIGEMVGGYIKPHTDRAALIRDHAQHVKTTINAHF